MQPLAQRTGVPVRWRPFLLGAAFKATGNETPARIPAKAAWMVRDMALWARQYGMPVAFPSRFPIHSVTPLRLLVAAGRLHGDDAIARSEPWGVWGGELIENGSAMFFAAVAGKIAVAEIVGHDEDDVGLLLFGGGGRH